MKQLQERKKKQFESWKQNKGDVNNRKNEKKRRKSPQTLSQIEKKKKTVNG